MCKQSIIYAVCCLVTVCFSQNAAHADSDDFFQMEREDVRSKLERLDAEDEAASNPGQPGATNAAKFGSIGGENGVSIGNVWGEKPSDEEIKAKKRKEGWSEFEDVSGTDAEKNYYNSRQMRIRNELSKPLPKRDSFSDENIYDELQNSVDALGTSKNK